MHVGPALAEGCVNATTISAQIAKAPIAIDSVRFMAFNRSNRPVLEDRVVEDGGSTPGNGSGYAAVAGVRCVKGGTRQFHYIIDIVRQALTQGASSASDTDNAAASRP